ncbi:MAG: hypothetical protein II579_03230 [Treponema sp.]|nr:hypothetical protein [Treponema sp.]
MAQPLNQVQGDSFYFWGTVPTSWVTAVIPGSDPESVEDKGCAYTDPESTFVASACECGVAVQGDCTASGGKVQSP